MISVHVWCEYIMSSFDAEASSVGMLVAQSLLGRIHEKMLLSISLSQKAHYFHAFKSWIVSASAAFFKSSAQTRIPFSTYLPTVIFTIQARGPS
jgi:hypothetical protein